MASAFGVCDGFSCKQKWLRFGWCVHRFPDFGLICKQMSPPSVPLGPWTTQLVAQPRVSLHARDLMLI